MEERVNGPEQHFVYGIITGVFMTGRLPEDHTKTLVALYGEPLRHPSELEVISELRAALTPYTKNFVFVDRPKKGDATIRTELQVHDESFYVVTRTLGELYELKTEVPR